MSVCPNCCRLVDSVVHKLFCATVFRCHRRPHPAMVPEAPMSSRPVKKTKLAKPLVKRPLQLKFETRPAEKNNTYSERLAQHQKDTTDVRSGLCNVCDHRFNGKVPFGHLQSRRHKERVQAVLSGQP